MRVHPLQLSIDLPNFVVVLQGFGPFKILLNDHS